MQPPVVTEKKHPAGSSGSDGVPVAVHNVWQLLMNLYLQLSGLVKFIAKAFGIFYAAILLFVMLIYFPLLLFDASIASFPTDKNTVKFTSNVFAEFRLDFSSNYQMLLFFSAVTGAIGGCVNAFYMFINAIETDEFKKKSIKDISLDVTILTASMVLRAIVGAGLGMLACFALTSGVLGSLVFDTTTLPGKAAKEVNNELVGALSLIAGLFANKVIDRVGRRFDK